MPSPTQLPTVEGKVDGIVGLDPLTMQCRECGALAAFPFHNPATSILLCGWGFHTCEPGSGRRCRACLSAAERGCVNAKRHA